MKMRRYLRDTAVFSITIDLLIRSTEQHRNAPQSGKAYECVYDPADGCGLTSKNPGHKVKLKNTDKAPVNGTDNGKD